MKVLALSYVGVASLDRKATVHGVRPPDRGPRRSALLDLRQCF